MNTFQFYRNSCRQEGRLKIHDLSKHLKKLEKEQRKKADERKQQRGESNETKRVNKATSHSSGEINPGASHTGNNVKSKQRHYKRFFRNENGSKRLL